jgi:hypothetical protein
MGKINKVIHHHQCESIVRKNLQSTSLHKRIQETFRVQM